MSQLRKATREQVKLRLNLSSPSGGGKTYSALLMAYGLVGNWDKIAVIDTENGSASLYSHLGDFNVLDLKPPFTPEKYTAAIKDCVDAQMECVIIDSSTHEWTCLLEQNEQLAQAKYRGNTWAALGETTPRHDRFIDSILHCNAHVITCTRSKTETVMGEDKKVKKVGIKDIQREGWEYELTVSLNIDRDTHKAIPSKDRTNLFENTQPFVITEDTGKLIADWCAQGVAPVPDASAAPDAALSLAACKTVADLKVWRSTTGATMTPKIKALFLVRYNTLNDNELIEHGNKQMEETNNG